jgi:histidinol phosphatase-like enzyme (inositol monophosphatase family)
MGNLSKSSESIDTFKVFAKQLSFESGQIIRSYFRTKLQVELKTDLSPVTLADKKSEEAMRELIMKEFPDHGILGEEFGIYNPDAEYKWILDPIDGTKSFISGTPLFGTLIALLKNGEPIIGAINLPMLNEFLIGDNSTAELNDKKVSVRSCSSISSALLLTTDILDIEKYQDINKFNTLVKKVKLFRIWGDCYGYYLVATGFADVMIDPVVSPWDSMALIPVIRGAGGNITDYQGNDPVKGKSIIASSPAIHKEILKILN